MQEYKYMSSSGKVYDWRHAPYFLESAEPFFSYTREVKATSDAIGGFSSKGIYERKIRLDITEGGGHTAAKNLEDILTSFETDVFNRAHGRVYIGGYYLDCYIYAGVYERRFSRVITLELTVVTDKNKWYREVAFYQISKVGVSQPVIEYQSEEDDFRDSTLPATIPFGYANPNNQLQVENPCMLPANFRLTFLGPWTNPSVTIGGSVKSLPTTTLAANDRVTIDSMKHTIIKNGSESLFSARDLAHDSFERLPKGELTVMFEGDNSFELAIIDERQTPEL